MIAATPGAIDAPRSRSSGARRILRTRTSSSVCASSRSAAHVTSASRYGKPSTRGRNEAAPALAPPTASTARASVPWRSTSERAASIEIPRVRGDAGRERVQLRAAAPRRSSAAPRSRSGAASPHRSRARASTASRAMTRYVVYLPPLTRTRPSRLDAHPVLAGHLHGRRRVRRRDQRSQPGVGADHVVARQPHVHRPVHRPEELVDVVAAGRRTVERPVVRLVRGADQPVARPGHEERDPARDPQRHPAARRDPLAGDDEVAAARRQDAEAALAERTVRAARPRRRSRRGRRSRAPRSPRPSRGPRAAPRRSGRRRGADPSRGPGSRRARHPGRRRAPSAATASV